ncbi:potassium-transporting ATPase subunit F [Vagococcus teuberi]
MIIISFIVAVALLIYLFYKLFLGD